MPANTKIRPPVVDTYDDQSKREVRTAIQQLSGVTTGRYLGKQALTGSGVYTPATGASIAEIWLVGAGGGGGGAGGGANSSGGAGGGTGVLVYAIIGTSGNPLLGGAFSCGAAGAGGSSAGGVGGVGGDTTLVIAGQTLTARGAGGGGGMTSATLATAFGGQGQAGSSSSSDMPSAFVRGNMGLTAGGGSFSGGGASCIPFGSGGAPGLLSVGGNAQGFGAGGGGANATAVGFAGGAGAPGYIIIKEYS